MCEKRKRRGIVKWKHPAFWLGPLWFAYRKMFPLALAYVIDPIADKRGFFEWKGESVSKLAGFYVYDEVGKEIKISEKPKPTKMNISYATIILSFLLIISILVSVSLWTEKNSISKKLDETVIEFNQEAVVVDKIQGENIETFRVCVVKEGDNVENICKEYGINYIDNITKIMKINGIKNIDKIYVGQKLYLPIK